MVGITLDWKGELGRWLKPFLDRLGHKARRQMSPLYVSGLIGPGDRNSIQPMAKRLALGECDLLYIHARPTRTHEATNLIARFKPSLKLPTVRVFPWRKG
jgi:hypothetical protein